MEKSEKIKRIKALQAEISRDVKEKKLHAALEKIDEILKLAPNLQKIKDLQVKITRRLEAAKSVGKTKKEENVKEVPTSTVSEDELEKKESVSRAEEKEVEEKPESEVKTEALSSTQGETATETDEESAEKESREISEKPEAVKAEEADADHRAEETDIQNEKVTESQPGGEASAEKELTLEDIEKMVKSTSETAEESDEKTEESEPEAGKPDKATAEQPQEVLETTQPYATEQQEVPVESLDELLSDVAEENEEPVSEEDFGILDGSEEEDLLTPEKVEKRLHELMEQEAEEEKERVSTRSGQESDTMSTEPDEKSGPELIEAVSKDKEEDASEPVEDFKQPSESEEEVLSEEAIESPVELSTGELASPPKTDSETELTDVEKDEELDLEGLISSAKEMEKEDKKEEKTETVFDNIDLDEPQPEKKAPSVVEEPKLSDEEINLEEIIASGKKEKPVIEPPVSEQKKSTVSEASFKKDAYSMDISEEEEASIPPQKTVIYGGKRKEKLDHSFKLSDEAGMGGAPQPEQPISQVASQDLDGAMEEIKKKGFKLRHIPQAIGFVFNMERLLYSTAGLLFVMVVVLLMLSLTISTTVGILTTGIISISLETLVAAFIAFTVIQQIDNQLHGRFSTLIPEFISQVLPSALLFWVFWALLLAVFGGFAFGFTYLLKLNTVIFAIVSPVSFVLIAITVSLFMASGLIAFVVPAVVAVDKPGPLTTVKETLFILKNHFFTIFGGYLFELILKMFIGILSLLVLFASYGMLFMMMMKINPQFVLKFLFSFEGLLPLEKMLGSVSPMMAAMTPPPMVGGEKIAAFILVTVLAAGAIFILSIPFIFQNAASVITFLTVKEKKQIIRHR